MQCACGGPGGSREENDCASIDSPRPAAVPITRPPPPQSALESSRISEYLASYSKPLRSANCAILNRPSSSKTSFLTSLLASRLTSSSASSHERNNLLATPIFFSIDAHLPLVRCAGGRKTAMETQQQRVTAVSRKRSKEPVSSIQSGTRTRTSIAS